MTTVDLALLIAMGVLFTGGVYLLLERSLTRIMVGVILVNNAVILLIVLSAGGVGLAPLRVAGTDPAAYADPLPQALVLTAIVIGFAVTAFLAAMIYRAWLLLRQDELLEDPEDVKVAGRSAWVAEDDSELVEEHSEFLHDAADPNADYELATPGMPRARPAAPRPAPAPRTAGPRPADARPVLRSRPLPHAVARPEEDRA